jgi:hypothetical protein
VPIFLNLKIDFQQASFVVEDDLAKLQAGHITVVVEVELHLCGIPVNLREVNCMPVL